VVDNETLFGQTELATAIAAEDGFAMAPEILLRMAVAVITRPTPTVRIEVRVSAGAAPPSRLHSLLADSAAQDMNGIDGESVFESGSEKLRFQPTRVE
jgi:hypothetical protein